MKKRGQLLAQPFIFIFAIIFGALILAFGTWAIFNIKERAELAELTLAITDIKKEVNSYYNLETGSSKELNIALPKKVEKICFTVPKEQFTKTSDQELNQLLQNNQKYHAFIFPINIFKLTKFEIPHLKPIKNPLCITTKNSLKAVIETKDYYVEIREK